MASGDLIGIGEAARILGLSVSRVRQLADQGLLGTELTPGGHRRFRPEQLRSEWLALRSQSDLHTAGTVRTWTYSLAGLAEDSVWADARSELGDVPTKARQILGYSVTEMANNAIDHSRGTSLRVSLAVRGRRVEVHLADDGIGAFQSMAETFGYSDLADAIVDLTKGKRTTAPERHSGEGIFFTSKAVDLFSLEANGYRFEVDNLEADVALGQGTAVGTAVVLALDLDTTRDLVEVFAAHTEDGEFVRTTPRVQLVHHGTEFLSRSQAKRFALGLEQFTRVELDFTGVDLIGQGFADELFRVWQTAHPDVRMEVVGANRGVALMISRVAKP